jgi:hypothetical protein
LAVAAILGVAALALEQVDGRGGVATDLLTVPVMLAYAVVGGLIGSRQPMNAVAWLLDLMSVAMLGAFFMARYAVVGYDGRMPAPGFEVTGALGWVWIAALACPILIAFVVPTGRPSSAFWGRMLRVSIAVLAVVIGIFAVGDSGYELVGSDPTQGVIPNPIYVPAIAPIYEFVNSAFVIYLVLFGLGAAALVTRFRSSLGFERQQLKWVAVGIVVMIALMALSNVLPAPLGDLCFALAIASLPMSLGVAILRFRLYDIDRIISRTVAYAIVTALLAAVFAGVVLLLQAALAPITTQVGSLSVAGSTLLVAALFQPLRRRVQAVADRRFNRTRYDAERELDAFAARVRDEVEVEPVAVALAQALERTVQPTRAAVWLRRDAA